ncbi:glycosyl transferase [Brevirhabdus pacifica]|uniref:peptidoglycan glycosyltransferase n=1 Tax=Brevirhabdus pacifica TaxID=1267768 RepID=A0A1U7DJK6_9RHOB|nr:transglycosylase domain-containing protein [Brevirhabdus pacifica]APX90048.1 glycosyl transferase [Brevirhabdus pacifica]OWU75359.1 glycosyl transferase [Loktanella sp. 22II-4b]PJJ82702.1 1A family penicillin-binding protein [Brevirhabdus pacifica]
MSSKSKPRSRLVADRRYSAKTKTGGGSGGGRGRPPSRSRKTNRKSSARRPRGLVGMILAVPLWFLRVFWSLIWRGSVVVILLVGLAVAYTAATLPPVAELLDGRAKGSVRMLDRYGEVFAWRGEQFGGAITTDTVAPVLTKAIVATEDRRFYNHFGLSPRGIASAISINLREGRGPLSGHGGSTITQQTAKLLCLGRPYDPQVDGSEADYEAECRRSTLVRKINEAIFAMAMEARYSKAEILTIYLNRAFLGAGARGFEAASQRYFGKSASQVDTAEAAMLAGLLVAPTRYAPTNDLKRSRDRASVVLGLMAEQGKISESEARQARANPATLSEAAQARAGGYFADWVMSSGPSFLTRDTTEDVIIRTTFDPRIQTAAEAAMKTIFADKVKEGSEAQAAIVVMSSDGAVRAVVGGRQTKVSGAFNRAVQAQRQTGSAFKPFVYAAALDLGMSPNSTVEDTPLTINIPGSGPWSPKNYDGKYRGRVTLTEALRNSLNTPAVRISEEVGRENVRRTAEMFGIKSDLAAGPALALGASESTLMEMTGAYAGILNGGRSVKPYGLTELRLVGESRSLMDQDGGMGERVISETAARQLTYMMSKVIDGGTGARARLPDREAAGKTGTTQAARDAWFVGFTADYVAGVWMGYDDNTPLTGVTGGGLPAEIWQDAMIRVHEGLPPQPLPMESGGEPVALGGDNDGGYSERQAPSRTQQRRQPNPAQAAERIILDVLGKILGGR